MLALIPLDLDGYVFTDGWKSGLRNQVRRRLAVKFEGWESSNDTFEAAFEKTAEALQTERESPPEPKL